MLCSDSNTRINSSWLGGSILASLSSMSELSCSKAEYDEFGSNIIDRKCP